MYWSSVHSANHAAKNIASSGRKYVSKCIYVELKIVLLYVTDERFYSMTKNVLFKL